MTKYNKVAKRVAEPKTVEPEEVEIEREVKRVVKKKVKPVKKGLMERMVVALIGPDGLPAVGRYVSSEVVGPAIKNMLVDTVVNGIQMLVFKDSAPQGRKPTNYYSNTGTTKTYTSAYKGASTYQRAQGVARTETKRSTWASEPGQAQQLGVGIVLQDWAVDDRADAENVLNALRDIGYDYGIARVREYYDLMGIPAVYTDNNYGWSFDSLNRVRIRTTRDGFVLDLPPVEAV